MTLILSATMGGATISCFGLTLICSDGLRPVCCSSSIVFRSSISQHYVSYFILSQNLSLTGTCALIENLSLQMRSSFESLMIRPCLPLSSRFSGFRLIIFVVLLQVISKRGRDGSQDPIASFGRLSCTGFIAVDLLIGTVLIIGLSLDASLGLDIANYSSSLRTLSLPGILAPFYDAS